VNLLYQGENQQFYLKMIKNILKINFIALVSFNLKAEFYFCCLRTKKQYL